MSPQSASARRLDLPVTLAWARAGGLGGVGGEPGLHFRKNRLICSGVSSGFFTAKAFQFDEMFQENIILEPVGWALGRRGCVITLRWSEQKQGEQGLRFTATKDGQEQVGGLKALLKEKVQTVREGTEPGVLSDRIYWKGPEPSHRQRLKKAPTPLGGRRASQAWIDWSQIPRDLIRIPLCYSAVCIPPSPLPCLITLSPIWKGFII